MFIEKKREMFSNYKKVNLSGRYIRYEHITTQQQTPNYMKAEVGKTKGETDNSA